MTRFDVGDWHVQPSLNRLSRGGEELRVEPKVMLVLEVLAETPGEVVTREVLVARVWPGVFVTDDVVHRAIRELRRLFGDDASNPQYVETIRKRGYRLIAPVRPADSETPAPSSVTPMLAVRPAGRSFALIASASILLAAAVGAIVYAVASRGTAAEPFPASVRFIAMTSGPLNETDPAISPDGSRLAFAMRPDASDVGPADVYITEGAGRTPERVTTHPADDRYPVWSPDARTLAFIRIDGRACDVMLMPLAERRERRLGACGNIEEPRLGWSADGEWLVESFAPGPDPVRGWRIARVSASSGMREELTLPSPGTLGDHSPAVSPDGSHIAFIRGINGATADLYVMPFSGGAPTRVTWDNQDLIGVDWSADGRSLVYATDRAGGYTIWRTGIDGGTPRLVVGGAAKLKHPSVARTTGRVTYESWSYEINLWEVPVSSRLDLEADAPPARPVVQTSDQWNHSPDFSPGGEQLAFVSTRSGSAELWLSDRDGGHPRQLTRFGRAAIRPPRWSPDAASILISASVNGQMDLYLVTVANGNVRRLTDDQDDEIAPSWSRDGLSVLFGARRSGAWQVMRMAIADRSRTQLTTQGGYAAQESPDGDSILFTRLEQPGVWMMPAGGGDARLLVPGVRAAENANWRVTTTGIYYIGATGDRPVIRRAPLSGGAAVDVAWIGNYSWPGFAISADGTRVIYAHWDRRESNIMAMEALR